MKKLKVGLVVECTPAGLEKIVCPKILALLATETGLEIECTIQTMTNKKLLIQDAAQTTQLLLAEGCNRVVILWDENPPWTQEQDFAKERCWHFERDQIIKSLEAAKVDLKQLALVCIMHEFETWLLHDVQLLRAVISTSAHPAKIKKYSDPVRIDDPKAALMGLFSKCKTRYNADVAATKFAAHLDSLNGLRRCDTFRYFAQGILGKMPNGWKPYDYQPKGPKKK